MEHRLSALLQLHLHSRLNTWHQQLGQMQLHGETRNIKVLGIGASYIRDLTVYCCILLNDSLKGIIRIVWYQYCIATINAVKQWIYLFFCDRNQDFCNELAINILCGWLQSFIKCRKFKKYYCRLCKTCHEIPLSIFSVKTSFQVTFFMHVPFSAWQLWMLWSRYCTINLYPILYIPWCDI